MLMLLLLMLLSSFTGGKIEPKKPELLINTKATGITQFLHLNRPQYQYKKVPEVPVVPVPKKVPEVPDLKRFRRYRT